MDLDLILRTSILLLVALALTKVLVRATAATRHLVWHVAVIAVLLAPALSAFTPRFDVRLPSWIDEAPIATAILSRATATASMSPCTEPACSADSATPASRTLGVPATPTTLARISSAGTWMAGLWFLFAWIASGWLAWRSSEAPAAWVADVRRIAARMNLSQPIRVRQSPTAGSPRVVGTFRPVILLPASASEWSTPDREAALVHELSHIRRRDRRTQALAQAACALYWFNPLVWVAAAALSRERERACDDEVLRAGVRPSTYATLLLDLAKNTQSWAPANALGMARASTIEGRLVAILSRGSAVTSTHSDRRSHPWTPWLILAGATVLTGAVLGAQQPTPVVNATDSDRKPVAMHLMDLGDRMPQASVTQALARALGDADRQVREKAALGLALLPGNETIGPLLTALGDADPQVREKAAIGLAFRHDARVIDPLLHAMDDNDSQVREKVAIALGASGDDRARGALERALQDPDPQVREKAASGLVLLGLRK